jgi:hypothetical protein
VSARIRQRARSNEWQSAIGASCALAFSVRTDDPAPSIVTTPAPSFVIMFSRTDALFAPQPPAKPPALPPPAREAPAELDNRVELIIDSLPHHVLSEPIPVMVDSIGDALCTASVRNLDINATGNGIGEALLMLKEQIAFVYDELNRRPQLSAEQKTTLQMLHTYIAPQPKKPEWL